MLASISMALDRSSVRSMDPDGRMRIAVSNISKANICPYLGSEIPGCEELGLEPKKIYRLFRDPDELAKAAPSFNLLPLLDEHHLATAEDPKQHKVIGASGSDAEFVAPYLRNSLVVWVRDAIDRIQSGEQQQISCAYRYTPDMTPGNYMGEPYDGVMRKIHGSHIALVPEGRAGSDVLVNDSIVNLQWDMLARSLLSI